MKLLIDTTHSDKVVIAIDDMVFEADSKVKKAQMLLQLIESRVRNQGASFSDISEIKVNTGPGSYTGIRVGVSVAQALAWELKIPVNGRDISKGEPLEINYD